jgi:hypothetical protein
MLAKHLGTGGAGAPDILRGLDRLLIQQVELMP